MHSVVDFQVDWPKFMFKSRPQIPCRDIIHVATSISRRDINLSLCSFQLMSSDVATSISCRDIMLCLCRFQLVAIDVTTSICVFGGSAGCFWCRDFSTLSRQQLELHQLHLSKPVIASRRFSCCDLHSLSRHQPLSRHHDAVATSFL